MRWSHIDIAVAACLGAVAFIASCRSPGAPRVVERVEPPAARPAGPAPPYLTGGRITALPAGALVVDADSGMLIRIGDAGQPTAQLAIGRDAGLVVHDPVRDLAFVADRVRDRVLVVDTRDTLAITAQWTTPAEPYGIALTPDRARVLVTTIADRTLVALDAQTGAEQWRVALSPEPRGISVASDGRRALVSSLATGALDHVELDGAHRVTSIAFDLACERCSHVNAFARGAGSVVFLDGERAVAAFQRSIPDALVNLRTGVYGGGSRPPVTQHLAFLSFAGDQNGQAVAQIVENQPRALAWDATRDTLFVTGYGSDTLLQLPGLSRSSTDGVEDKASNAVLRASNRCGPDGLAVTAEGDLLIWCALSRTVLRLADDVLTEGPQLVASALTAEQQRGRELFYTTNPAVNRDRALACSSCHLEGRTDGLSWKIGKQALQTPILAGRMVGTQPYKWDGSDPTLRASIASTIRRLNGTGLGDADSAALVAYLEALPRPRTPTLDREAVARGAQVFAGAGGCTDCHGGTAYTDGEQHQFHSSLENADTPSLIGLAASAPYYHDGSAATLDALLEDRGAVHGMADLAKLTREQRRDLRAFLDSL